MIINLADFIRALVNSITAVKKDDFRFATKCCRGLPQYVNCDEKKLAQIVILLTNTLHSSFSNIFELILKIKNIESVEKKDKKVEKIIPFALVYFTMPHNAQHET